MDLGNRPWLLRGVVVGVALVVALVAWIAGGDGDEGSDGGEPAAPVATEVRIVDEDELAEVAADSEYPIYWAGPLPDTSLELTENTDGSFQVRYLPEGAEAGDESAPVLAVATYPLEDPAGALESFAAEPGSASRRSEAGAEVVTSKENPNSVYFASPDNSVQVEVFDPSPRRALNLALTDRVQPAQ